MSDPGWEVDPGSMSALCFADDCEACVGVPCGCLCHDLNGKAGSEAGEAQ